MQRQPRIPDQACLDAVVRADHHRIDIDMDDRHGASRYFTMFSGGRSGAASDKDYRVGLLDRCARFVRPAVRADDTDRERV